MMWWILNFIPDSLFVWVTYILMTIGVGLYVASKLVKWIPMIGQYKLPAELGGIAVLLIGTYLFGGYGVQSVWEARVKELQDKVAVAEGKSKQLNDDLTAERKKKQKVIIENKVIYRDRIVEVAQKIDAECKVAPEAIEILNDAAKNQSGEKK